MQDVLNATDVRKHFGPFIDSVVREKPRAVKRNRDVIWSFSEELTNEILSRYTFQLEYEMEEDGSLTGSLQQIEDIIVSGSSEQELVTDAAEQLIEYAQDYYSDFNRYFYSTNRRIHLPFIFNVLVQKDIESVKKLIHA